MADSVMMGITTKVIEKADSFGPFIGIKKRRLDGRGREIPMKGTEGGHIKTVLNDIGQHINSHLGEGGSFGEFFLDDVEVYLPLIDNLRIEGSRHGLTGVLLANSLKSREYPLRRGVIRSSYQLPVAFTMFKSGVDISDDALKKDGTVSTYDIMSIIPIIMRYYDGGRLGVMRVSVMNSQITRNTTNIEGYDGIYQFNMMIYGVIDYRQTSRYGGLNVIVETHQTDLFGDLKNTSRLGISDNFGNATGGISAQGTGSSKSQSVFISTSGAGGGAQSAAASGAVHKIGSESSGISLSAFSGTYGVNKTSLMSKTIEKSSGLFGGQVSELHLKVNYDEPDEISGNSGITISDIQKVDSPVNKNEVERILVAISDIERAFKVPISRVTEVDDAPFATLKAPVAPTNLITESTFNDSATNLAQQSLITITDIENLYSKDDILYNDSGFIEVYSNGVFSVETKTENSNEWAENSLISISYNDEYYRLIGSIASKDGYDKPGIEVKVGTFEYLFLNFDGNLNGEKEFMSIIGNLTGGN